MTVRVYSSRQRVKKVFFGKTLIWEEPDDVVLLTVKSSNPEGGTATGSGAYETGGSATLRASPNPGFVFQKWDDGDVSPTRTVTAVSDKSYVATFAPRG